MLSRVFCVGPLWALCLREVKVPIGAILDLEMLLPTRLKVTMWPGLTWTMSLKAVLPGTMTCISWCIRPLIVEFDVGTFGMGHERP